jgi:hypothetical protein
MDEQVEAVWRKALQVRGKEWVLAELQRRSGQPDDVVLDVVFEEPYPTRDFCRQWCAEVESRLFSFSWHTQAAFVAMILFVVCCVKAIEFSNTAPPVHAPAATAAMPTGRAVMSNAIPTMTSDIPRVTSTTSTGTSSGSTSTQSSCAYITYPTAQCNNR